MSIVNTTVADIIRERFDGTDVEMFPLGGPDGMKTDLYGLFLTGDGSHVTRSAVTKGYTPHTVAEMATLGQAAFNGMELDQDNVSISTYWDGMTHRVSIGPGMSEQSRGVSIHGTKDYIFPRICISGGFSGRGFQGQFGLWRHQCSNLQMPKMIRGYSRSFRHTRSLTDRISDLTEAFHSLTGTWTAVTDLAAELDARRVDMDEFISELYPLPDDASDRQVTKFRNRARHIVRHILNERYRMDGDSRRTDDATLWELVNGVTSYVQHDKTRQGDRVTPEQRAFMAIADGEADDAWAFAQNYLAA